MTRDRLTNKALLLAAASLASMTCSGAAFAQQSSTTQGTLGNAPGINPTSLVGHGFGAAEIAKVEAALRSAFDIRFVFNQWTLGEEFCTGVLGIPVEKLRDPAFDLLLTGESSFDDLPTVLPRLASGELRALCHTVAYAPEEPPCSA